jgi:hypothetical protein
VFLEEYYGVSSHVHSQDIIIVEKEELFQGLIMSKRKFKIDI